MVIAAAVALPATAEAQRYRLVIDERTFEGDLLNLIDAEMSPERRIPLLEKFLKEFPRHEAVAWIWQQIQAAHIKLERHAPALAAGEKLFAMNPADLLAAYDNLILARKLGNATAEANWIAAVESLAARYRQDQMLHGPDWELQSDLARQLGERGDYDAYARMRSTNDPRQIAAAGKELLAKFPSTKYAAEARLLMMNAMRGSGDLRGAAETAEAILAVDAGNADALFVASHAYLQMSVQSAKAADYAGKLLTAVGKNDSAGAQYYRGMAHWIIGTLEIREKRFKEAEASLRVAERYLADRAEAQAPLTFYLGWANYNLERLAEAERYFQRCSQMQSQYRAEAINNLTVVRKEMVAKN